MAVFDEELAQLKGKLLKMGALVESAIKDSVRALLDKSEELAKQVLEREHEVNALDVEVDEMCFKLIALRQPKAGDLRFITTAMKITTDIERMGDLAVNIAQRALELKKETILAPFVDIPRMREIAQGMTRDALDSFVNKDKRLAMDVIMRDQKIDDLKHTILGELLMLMTEAPERICWAMKISFVAQYLERIADHATNVAEMVIYLAEGRIIRHMSVPTDVKEECR
ncbi:MAG TPA: phosphate signaling complex protein PhoU [Dissulfurispiraceae bacterium]|jgi:phosphate transport system protein|nr:phosphate signaling complex protein PhoU [Dissulfurispiraceae bacterium]